MAPRSLAGDFGKLAIHFGRNVELGAVVVLRDQIRNSRFFFGRIESGSGKVVYVHAIFSDRPDGRNIHRDNVRATFPSRRRNPPARIRREVWRSAARGIAASCKEMTFRAAQGTSGTRNTPVMAAAKQNCFSNAQSPPYANSVHESGDAQKQRHFGAHQGRHSGQKRPQQGKDDRLIPLRFRCADQTASGSCLSPRAKQRERRCGQECHYDLGQHDGRVIRQEWASRGEPKRYNPHAPARRRRVLTPQPAQPSKHR